MLQVVEVELEAAQHLLHGVGVAVVERGVGGDAWTHLIEVGVVGVVLHDLVDVELALGARSDEGHVAHEHIPELRQFVEVVLAQCAANGGETRVAIVAGKELRTLGFGVGVHGAEFIDEERPSAAPDALLAEESRAAVAAANGYVAVEEERREDHEADGRNEDVEQAGDETFACAHAVLDGDIVGFCHDLRGEVAILLALQCVVLEL